MVVDNRPGAGGVLASSIVAAAAGDGYTLFMHSMAHVITPAVYSKLPYDTLRDFSAVSQVAGVPNVLVDQFVRADIHKLGRIVKAAGVKAK